MSMTSLAEPIIIPGPPLVPDGYVHKNVSEKEILRRLELITSGIVGGKPIGEIVVETMRTISALFGLTGMVFESRNPVIRPTLSLALFGYSRESAEAIVKNLSSDLYPQEVRTGMLSDKFSVSRNGYFISSEEWLKLSDENPMCDHPAYHFRPEQVGLPRTAPDQWHEADSYRYVARDDAGEILGLLEIHYSLDNKLPSKDVVESIDAFVDLAAIALEREVRRLEGKE